MRVSGTRWFTWINSTNSSSCGCRKMTALPSSPFLAVRPHLHKKETTQNRYDHTCTQWWPLSTDTGATTPAHRGDHSAQLLVRPHLHTGETTQHRYWCDHTYTQGRPLSTDMTTPTHRGDHSAQIWPHLHTGETTQHRYWCDLTFTQGRPLSTDMTTPTHIRETTQHSYWCIHRWWRHYVIIPSILDRRITPYLGDLCIRKYSSHRIDEFGKLSLI